MITVTAPKPTATTAAERTASAVAAATSNPSGSYRDVLAAVREVEVKGDGCDEISRRLVVVITGRCHPGETSSSFVLEGIVDFLTGDSADAAELLSKFVFKLVPMMNPDGVVVGNYRCSLEGYDLNRTWLTPLEDLTPSVYHVKVRPAARGLH